VWLLFSLPQLQNATTGHGMCWLGNKQAQNLVLKLHQPGLKKITLAYGDLDAQRT
jgi:hypothetical protein